jgi:molybdate transport system regulatory protein
MRLSIRNQFSGIVTAVRPGEVMATVKTRLSGGQHITSAITLEAVKDLDITEGVQVHVLIKSTEVSLAVDPIPMISIRNQIPGDVAAIATGDAMATVKVSIDGGELTAAITAEAVADLGLTVGSSVVALVKSTEISLAT